MKKKNSIKRAQSQARLSFAERKDFRPMAKILTLLVLLMTAVTGAWADTTVTWTSSDMPSNFYAQFDGWTYNNTHQGITVTASGDAQGGWSQNQIDVNEGSGTITFTSSVGNIKSIVITADNMNNIDEWHVPAGWTANNTWDNPRTLSWNGTASASVNLPLSDGQNFSNISTIVFTLSDPDYYLVGNMTSWGIDPQYKLALNESAGDANEYQIALALPAATELKVVSSTDGTTIKDWFPAEAGNKYVQNDGLYTIYFRPGYNGGDDWYEKCIYVADGVSFTADGEAWTLAQMPACDVELEVEYYPLATLATTPAAAEGVVEGTDAALLTPGTSAEGTLAYAIGTSEAPTGQWSDAIPTAQDLAAGTCYVWYKVVGDAEHSDSQPQSIAVTIAEAPAYAVTIDDAGVDAAKWSATPAEQIAGQNVTLSYSGKKKIRSITIEKKPTTVTWDSSTLNDVLVKSGVAFTAGDITLSGGSSSQNQAAGYSDYVYIMCKDAGGFTFTAPSGKKFTKIEMTPYDQDNIDVFLSVSFSIGTGWSSYQEISTTGKVTWKGEASSVDMLKGVNGINCKVSKIVFTLVDGE